MKKEEALLSVEEEIKLCRVCPVGKSGKPVPGEGNADASVVFIGEAPGKQEAQTGRPFIGRSGKFLRKNIVDIGLSERDVYITSPVKYLPDRGTPSRIDIEHGREHLIKQLTIIDPKIIVLLGSVAARAVLQEKIPIAKLHGKTISKGGVKYFISYHPAAAIRFYALRKDFLEDFKKLKNLLNTVSD